MRPKTKVRVGLLIFLGSYPLLLLAWIQVKAHYGHLLAEIGARMAAATMSVTLETVRQGSENAVITFVCPILTQSGLQELLIDLNLSTSAYSFNVPLTYALVLALWPAFRWNKRSLLEITLILITVHLLFIYSYCALSLYRQLATNGIKAHSKAIQFTLEFLWAFTDNMIVRFEPFLVAVYLWFRRSRSVDHQTAATLPD